MNTVAIECVIQSKVYTLEVNVNTQSAARFGEFSWVIWTKSPCQQKVRNIGLNQMGRNFHHQNIILNQDTYASVN